MIKSLILFFFLLFSSGFYIYGLVKEEIKPRTREHSPIQASIKLSLIEDFYPMIISGIDCLVPDGSYSSKVLELMHGESTYFHPDVDHLNILVNQLFRERLAIRELFIKNKDEHCYGKLKMADLALRYFEDYIIELIYQSNISQDFPLLQGSDFSYFLINMQSEEKFESWIDLESGDILLSRSLDYISAYSAKCVVHESQFSHLSFVYQPPNRDGMYIVESGGEGGVEIIEIEEIIKQDYARMVVLRPRPEFDGAKAAMAIYDFIIQKEKEGRKIDFDFTIREDPNIALFCSEVIYEGFRLSGNMSFPDRKSSFKPSLLEFVNSTGIAVTAEDIHLYEIFLPGDAEFDSHLDVIAEYRNPALIRDSRQKDVTLNKMFSWIKSYDYRIRNPRKIQFKGHLYYILRRLPLISEYFKSYLPLNLNQKQISAFLMLKFLGTILQDALNEEELRRGQAMTLSEMEIFLDEYRLRDREARRPDFHRWFSP
jgi:hypothetical protein